MAQRIVQFGLYPEVKYIVEIEGSTKKPLVIPYRDKKNLMIPWGDSTYTPITKQTLRIPVEPKATMVIKRPYPIPYKNDKAVPWSYDPAVYVNGSKQEYKPSSSQEPAISNIEGTEGITRNGRVF